MIYIDDSIMQKGKAATAGSRILENFKAPFDATVITRLTEDTERVTLSEFGLGEPGELPEALMLCNDIFGYVRRQAARQGLCYIRPTYGTVSRYGLIPTASSMDQIGIVCKDPNEGFALLEKIADKTIPPSVSDTPPRRGISLPPYADVCEPVMQILAYAEISSNISRYDGIKFGHRASNYRSLNDLYTKTRTEGFGLEAKLAAVMGSLVLSQEHYTRYYDKAMKIRRLIKESLPFDEYDILEVPVESPLAVLCGLPSVTFSGVQLVSDINNESLLMKAVIA
jgi:aspartyl-tRNA(Asn)/glutamyl-tRNA(Gln) amidotransferase subunit A